MENDEVMQLLEPLWNDVREEEAVQRLKPKLAHYTSIEALEKILISNEIWFSNPLLMNDLEEVRFGIVEGAQLFLVDDEISAASGSTERYDIIQEAFESQYKQFESVHALDTYVFCLTEHDSDDTDGLLSMWRGYGGNGRGVAIVFDTSTIPEIPESPLIVARVTYASYDERIKWIKNKLREFARLLSSNTVPDDKLWVAVYSFFERLKVFALFTKHKGFSEEREWRAVYLPDRDRDQRLSGMLDYSVANGGIEPKLKFKVGPIDGVTGDDLSLETLVHQIILGPSASSSIVVNSIHRMLKKHGKTSLVDRVVISTTPFRSTR